MNRIRSKAEAQHNYRRGGYNTKVYLHVHLSLFLISIPNVTSLARVSRRQQKVVGLLVFFVAVHVHVKLSLLM